MKQTNQRTHQLILVCALLAAVAGPPAAGAAGGDELRFEDRVDCRRALEEVYWRQRIWPASNPGPKPALADVLPAERLRSKVEDSMRMSDALGELWQRPLTAAQLQAEIDHMARSTRNPEMLRELWQALGSDPSRVAECLARPALADRLARAWYAFDGRFHGLARALAEADLERYGDRGEMAAMSGRYELQVWHRATAGDRAALAGAAAAADERLLDTGEWDAAVADLGARLGVASALARAADLPLAKISRLQEDEHRFYVLAVVEAAAERLVVASVAWPKVPFDEWWQAVRSTIPPAPPTPAAKSELRLPAVEGTGCAPDTWSPIRAYPRSRAGHVAVWTGSEMLIWGGRSFFSDSVPGGWYDPAIDAWYPLRMEGQPLGRADATAVWTGTEMVVWGGWQGADVLNVVNTGGRYNPATDTWAATSTDGDVPAGRTEHRAVWTGTEMIVWGGCASALGCGAGYYDTGARYDPVADSWTPTSTAGAAAGRSLHSAVWTGSEMVVWGGRAAATYLDDGGRYDPVTDAWSPMTTINAPQARIRHTAVATGSEMIVFGGSPEMAAGGGARYDLAADTWTAISTAGAPGTRYNHVAVWTGSEMIVQGGCRDVECSVQEGSGGRYDPVADAWTATSFDGAPFTAEHTAVWTGSEMIVWGGCSGGECQSSSSFGARYDPAADSWVVMSYDTGPSPRTGHSAVWTGSEMLIWAGGGRSNNGKRYDPATDHWTAINFIGSPVDRRTHTAVWTGTEMIIWGGSQQGQGATDTGGRYDPTTDSWTATSTLGAGDERDQHTAVWTGTEMIVWGGCGGSTCVPFLDSGARYDPATDSWTQTATLGAPARRARPASVWTGSEMIVWGGWVDGANQSNSGGRYDPVTDSWSPTSLTAAPAARRFHTASWTGSEMIVWGGRDDAGSFGDGGRYDPAADAWTPVSETSAPMARDGHSAVWTGSEVIVWGGANEATAPLAGGRYDPATNGWSSTNAGPFTPAGRVLHTVVWTGDEMIIWGGSTGGQTDTGGRYCAAGASSVFGDGFESGDTSAWSTSGSAARR